MILFPLCNRTARRRGQFDRRGLLELGHACLLLIRIDAGDGERLREDVTLPLLLDRLGCNEGERRGG